MYMGVLHFSSFVPEGINNNNNTNNDDHNYIYPKTQIVLLEELLVVAYSIARRLSLDP
jgi:hypothetical protein